MSGSGNLTHVFRTLLFEQAGLQSDAKGMLKQRALTVLVWGKNKQFSMRYLEDVGKTF